MKYINKGRYPVGLMLGDTFTSIAVGAVVEVSEHPGSPFVAEGKKAPVKPAKKKVAKKEVTVDDNNNTKSSKLG